ncbi:MAG: hypothetical protein R6U17_08620 [Thermoplasmata archaeon]
MKGKSSNTRKWFPLDTEVKLMEIIYPRVAGIPDVRVGLNVLTEILNYLCEYEDITMRSVRAYREYKQADKYVMFLMRYGYIETDDEYTFYPGEKMRELQSMPGMSLSTENEIRIIKELLENAYIDIVDGLNLQNVVPYARISNTYYLSAVESDTMLRMDEGELRERMKYIYDQSIKRNKLKTLKHLRELNEADILLREKEKFYGQEDILEKFSKKINLD